MFEQLGVVLLGKIWGKSGQIGEFLGQWLWTVGVLVSVVGSNGVCSASFGFLVFELFWVFNFCCLNFYGFSTFLDFKFLDMRSRRVDLIYLNVVELD